MTSVAGVLQRHADEADLHRPEILDRGAGEEGPAVLGQDVGGEEPELRAGERLDRAGRRLVCFAQPPFCIRSSSALPLSNSWLPTALYSTPTQVHRGDRRLVEEQSDETSGEAPIMSPAETVTLCGWPARSALSAPAR